MYLKRPPIRKRQVINQNKRQRKNQNHVISPKKIEKPPVPFVVRSVPCSKCKQKKSVNEYTGLNNEKMKYTPLYESSNTRF